jgi:uncharacterized protein with NRDE domain
MCTVSFIPIKDKFIITSNRDEKVSRARAFAPGIQENNGCKLVYPRDADKGGTWIAMKDNGDAGVLLNGAFLPHHSTSDYRKSRGILFLDIFKTDSPIEAFDEILLDNIEPFTIILFEKRRLLECRWNGCEKFRKKLSVTQSHIWSSATLYDKPAMIKRQKWFEHFLSNHPVPTQLDILRFHQFGGDGDQQTDLLMKREDKYSTVSITSILLTSDRGSMKYLDMKLNTNSEIKLEFMTTQQA